MENSDKNDQENVNWKNVSKRTKKKPTVLTKQNENFVTVRNKDRPNSEQTEQDVNNDDLSGHLGLGAEGVNIETITEEQKVHEIMEAPITEAEMEEEEEPPTGNDIEEGERCVDCIQNINHICKFEEVAEKSGTPLCANKRPRKDRDDSEIDPLSNSFNVTEITDKLTITLNDIITRKFDELNAKINPKLDNINKFINNHQAEINNIKTEIDRLKNNESKGNGEIHNKIRNLDQQMDVFKTEAKGEIAAIKESMNRKIEDKIDEKMVNINIEAGAMNIPSELIKIMRKEELKTIIIHNITNTNRDVDMFKLDPFAILHSLAENIDQKYPDQQYSMKEELKMFSGQITEAKFGYYKKNTDKNKDSRPLYVVFMTVEKAEMFKQWLYKAKHSLKQLGYTHDQLYNINVTNKRSRETIRCCTQMEESFNNQIRPRLDVFDRVFAEIEPTTLNVTMKMRLKEELAKSMGLKRWTHMNSIVTGVTNTLQAGFSQDDFLETLKSYKIRFDKIRMSAVNRGTIGPKKPRNDDFPPLLPPTVVNTPKRGANLPSTVTVDTMITSTPQLQGGNTQDPNIISENAVSHADVVKGRPGAPRTLGKQPQIVEANVMNQIADLIDIAVNKRAGNVNKDTMMYQT